MTSIGSERAQVSLREVTRDSVRAICRLDVGAGQRGNVAPNAVSIAQAYFQRDVAWFRGIYAGDEPVGFVMLYDPSAADKPEEPDFFLWRLMIDEQFQGKGYGRRAVELLIDHVRARGATQLLVSHVTAAEELRRFYTSLGFVYTGQEEDGELVMALLIA